jgi:hypothetical protein
MATRLIRSFPLAALSLAVAVLTGCASLQPRDAGPDKTEDVAAAPKAAGRAAVDLSASLRCMDGLLLDYGARDLALSVEDLSDPGRGTSAGSRELLVAAVSDMTRRSRAVRLAEPAGGAAAAQALRPDHLLRGSIQRFDDRVRGLDLTLLYTRDMTVVPGLASRNQASSSGQGGEARVRRFGVDFALPDGGSPEDERHALRALAEIGAIEVIGRLAKVPYWACLGATDEDPEVAAEVRDWYDTMAARPKELIEYFQVQLRQRGVYDGPTDGAVNPQTKEAVARYREALGLSREPKLSEDFLKAYLRADHRALQARLQPAAAAPETPPESQAALTPAVATPVPVQKTLPGGAALPLALRVGTAENARQFERGQKIQLTVKPSRDAHVYCFLQDENRQITRFFPNRFQPDSRVAASAGLQLPGSMRFEITMNARGVKETVSCFATEDDVMARLPGALNARDFAPLAVGSLEQVREAFVQASSGALAHDSLQVRPR